MKLNRGVNLGGFLSQCTHEESHYTTFIGYEDIERIADWGCDHVRLPVDYEVFEDEDGNVNESGYAHVKQVISWCEKVGLDVVLDLHKAYGYDFNNAGDNNANNLFVNESLKQRFVKLWLCIAERFGTCKNVAFELLNEVVEEENAKLWNELIARTVTAIRTVTVDTLIIYGGIQWNSVKTLKLLDVPTDKYTIFTFHFYEPLVFTYQKAYWVLNMDPKEETFYPETMEYYVEKSEKLGYQGRVVATATSKIMGKEFIREMIMEAIDAAKNANVKLYCGEFGVIDQAPLEDTLRWFRDVFEVFREYQIGYAVWTYKEKDFGIIGEHYDAIREEIIADMIQ